MGVPYLTELCDDDGEKVRLPGCEVYPLVSFHWIKYSWAVPGGEGGAGLQM